MNTAFKSAALAVAIAGAVGASLIPAPVHAQIFCYNCSTILTQLMQYVEDAEQTIQDIEQTANQIEQIKVAYDQYAEQLKQGQVLSGTQMSQAGQQLQQLQQLMQQGQLLASHSGDMSSMFRQKYPQAGDFAGASASDFQRWAQNMTGTAQGALQALQQLSQLTGGDSDRMGQLQGLSNSAGGQMQAIQVGNAMAAEAFGQMQKLNQLASLQAQLYAEHLAQEQSDLAASKAQQSGAAFKHSAAADAYRTDQVGGY